jgi:hypothetical protein
MIEPGLIIAGAPKSGTSSLHFWLDAHPQTLGARRKDSWFFADEINRFNQRLNFKTHGMKGFQTLFTGSSTGKLVFESTANYLYFPSAIQNIASLSSKPKVLFLLREPIARMLSDYLFLKFRVGNYTGTLEEYLQLPSLLVEGDYLHHIRQWEEALGKDRVLVYLFEDLMTHKEATMQRICVDLGIEPGFYAGFDFTHRNETVKIKRGWLHRLGLKWQPYFPLWAQNLILPLYLKVNAGQRPELTPEERARAYERYRPLFRPKVADLEQHLGQSLAVWGYSQS